MLRDAFGNADGEGDLGVEGLLDTGSSERGAIFTFIVSKCPSALVIQRGFLRNEDGGGSSASLLNGLAHILEDGAIKMCLASLLGVCAANNLGT